MTKKYSPVIRHNKKNLPTKRSGMPTFKMSGGLPNIFHNNEISSQHATRGNRIHCVAVQRTAIYKDANGNKIILKENQETMNTPYGVGSLSFSHGGRKWNKR